MQTATDLDRLATALVVGGSRFARTAVRVTNEQHSVVGMRVLSNLERAGALRVGELARREGITQPAMTTTVNRLEADGLVARGADAADLRASVVTLTDAGRRHLADFRARTARAIRPALDGLDDDELATLARAADLLDRLIADLEETLS